MSQHSATPARARKAPRAQQALATGFTVLIERVAQALAALRRPAPGRPDRSRTFA